MSCFERHCEGCSTSLDGPPQAVGFPLIACSSESQLGSVENHRRLPTAKLGQHTFTVTAVDTDGQRTKKVVHYRVNAT
jgi:hypothetical protein